MKFLAYLKNVISSLTKLFYIYGFKRIFLKPKRESVLSIMLLLFVEKISHDQFFFY